MNPFLWCVAGLTIASTTLWFFSRRPRADLDWEIGMEIMPQAEYDASVRDLDAAKASLAEAIASRDEAKIALESTIDGVNTSVLSAEESLQTAKA